MTKKLIKNSFQTPLMKQYYRIKAQHPGALLLFRVGDFYETFGEDAIKMSKILDIVLTKRANGAAATIELAGFPYHALDNHLPKLVRAGQRVAICDQLENPKFSLGIVKRGITELVTPGLSFHDNVLETKRNNYLASLFFFKEIIGIAFLDVTTGEFLVAQGNKEYIDKLLQSFNPSEVLFNKKQREIYENHFSDSYNHFKMEDWIYTFDYAFEKLTNHFKTTHLKGFGIDSFHQGIIAAGSILYYLELTQHHHIQHITRIARIEKDTYVWLDKFTIRNLELLQPQHENGVSVINILDKCITSMGSRMLRKWIILPLKDKLLIEERLNIVAFFLKESSIREKIQNNLKQIGDMERLISKVAALRINPRELSHLHKSLKYALPIRNILLQTQADRLKRLGDRLHPCDLLIEKIQKELAEDPPILSNQGGIIKDKVSSELDELRKIASTGKKHLAYIQKKEIQQTGIDSLKISYNKVFGYYLEVRNIHKKKVPPQWIRKQTLVNAERYVTQELKEYEEKVISAEEKMIDLEQKLFTEIVQNTHDYISPIQQNARILATLDCLLAFSNQAEKQNYCCPIFTEDKSLYIKQGRHPVIEQQMPADEIYVPNDIFLDDKKQQIMIITGPNMAGKSALLRQTALIILMAQMGSFVPAQKLELGLVDKVFTRVGASDNISRGESTFMVEMTETASILNNMSNRSLILMDEIGRGTSTYDGISIAWAIVEFLYKHPFSCKTLFATHYHELNQLNKDFSRIKNFNVSVKETNNKVLFIRKLEEGGSKHSFGIRVAQMAGIPPEVIIRANEIMSHLEKDKVKQEEKKKLNQIPSVMYQMNMFEDKYNRIEQINHLMNSIDINTLTPVEALFKLNEIKQIWKY